MISAALRIAATDYIWFLDRGYPTAGSIKMVGDRYRLSHQERQMLFRGVAGSDTAEGRSRRILDSRSVRGFRLGVDGHNVLLTIANYLRGVPVFEANDGLIRDVGSVHGNVHDDQRINTAIAVAVEGIAAAAPSSVDLCFDEPVSHSRDHAGRVSALLDQRSISNRVHLAPSADGALRGLPIDVLATSDSVLIDSLGIPVFDLGRAGLVGRYDPDFPSFRQAPSGTIQL